MNVSSGPHDEALEIIAFMLHEQQFCVRTTAIREIRGWAPVTPLPHAPAEVIGVMNLRGTVIPIVDLAVKLAMPSTTIVSERSAIVVTHVQGRTIGLMVDRVSDILSIAPAELQPIPAAAARPGATHAEAIYAHGKELICLLNLDAMFAPGLPEIREWAA